MLAPERPVKLASAAVRTRKESGAALTRNHRRKGETWSWRGRWKVSPTSTLLILSAAPTRQVIVVDTMCVPDCLPSGTERIRGGEKPEMNAYWQAYRSNSEADAVE